MSAINTNLASLNSQRNLMASQSDLNTSIQRLSSGLRVNSAKDDAAGLSIATKMDSQIRGMSQGIRNANDGISLAQTADSGLATATDALQRMRELAVQASNGTNSSDDLKSLNKEYKALATEVSRIATDTKFNGAAVLAGTAATTIQVGANTGSGQQIDIPMTNLATSVTGAIGASGTPVDDLEASGGATTALTNLDAALVLVNENRADLGATQNRLGYAINSLQSSVENQSAAKSRIMDTDFASETAKLTRGQILQQAGTAMLAQANSLPNGVMALLRG